MDVLPNAIVWNARTGVLELLDQRALPGVERCVVCRDAEEAAQAIENMTVRGAPAIGIAAAYGVALAAPRGREAVVAAMERLARTRPTAVNLFGALSRMRSRLESAPNEALQESLLDEARRIHDGDVEANRRLGRHGAALLPQKAAVLTHCNAGAIATGGHGTALGILRSAREAGKTIQVYADETRPRLQGARLTAWELARDGFDVTLICDGMAAALMKGRKIDAVIVGADRIAANGDTANKTGTYMLAIAAAAHGVPFYAAAPRSTLDPSLPSGAEIPIEVRSDQEVRRLFDGQSVPEAVKIWNPAFDVTPAELITAIITEDGVFRAPYRFV
ncbi:MAG: S-methyl-5-thioribose-1-phosphate isomerase [Synergistaceae bacterium]|jgi:methylthioribose-1-phosphate isomerase|nr:S-methyl-5-thioribose-1-phosphate isomerase [Synergistaceae bacterium]